MNCESCGTPINEGQTSCYKCGAPVLPKTDQSSEMNKVLNDPTAAEQKLPPFVQAQSDVRQAAAQKAAKKINVFAYISLFLGIIALILVILSARGNSGTVSLFEYAFFALFADIVFSIIGFIKSMSIKESKPIAIAGLIICIIDFIITLLVFALIVWPIMYQRFYQFTHSGPF